MYTPKPIDTSDIKLTDDIMELCEKLSENGVMADRTMNTLLHVFEAYTELHKLGFVSSIEVWQTQPDNEKVLVGGLYGVTLKNAFFGESMFSLVPNASKIALIFLAQFLERRGAHFIDCQFETSLFKSMGGRHIPYDEYMSMLNSRN